MESIVVSKLKTKKDYKYKSGLESKTAKYLSDRNVDFTYESTRIPFTVPQKHRHYVPDFTLPNGIIVECKGRLDRLTREKMALVIEQNPLSDIRFVFQRDNKISKVSKTKYSDWCIQRNIKYAVSEQGVVPESWINEPANVVRPSSLDTTTASVKPKRKRKSRSLSDSISSDSDIQDN